MRYDGLMLGIGDVSASGGGADIGCDMLVYAMAPSGCGDVRCGGLTGRGFGIRVG